MNNKRRRYPQLNYKKYNFNKKKYHLSKNKRYESHEIKYKPSLLFWSSLVLVTNMWTAFITRQYIYSFLFASLVISSLIVHTYNCIWTNLWDKIWVSSIVLYGGYKMWQKRELIPIWKTMICVLTFLFCVFVYCYGYLTRTLCFCSKNGNEYHATMHIIASLGHHFIIFI